MAIRRAARSGATGDQPGLRRLRGRRRRDGDGEVTCRPPTATSGAGWAATTRRSTWAAPRSPPPPRSAARSPTRGSSRSAGGHAMNLVEKILARASGMRVVTAGDIVVGGRRLPAAARPERVSHLAGVRATRSSRPMRYPDRVVMVFDHHFSPPTEDRARVLGEPGLRPAARHPPVRLRQRQHPPRRGPQRVRPAGHGGRRLRQPHPGARHARLLRRGPRQQLARRDGDAVREGVVPVPETTASS